MSKAFFFIVIVKLLILNIIRASALGNLYTSDANKTYYIDFERKYSWFEGEINCTQMNMTLVEIKTKTKSQELYSLIEKVQEQNNIEGDFIWIGGILNRFPTKQFVWLSTGEDFTYTNWYDNNPDFFYDNEFCVELVRVENWRWNDDSCITRGGFICECKEEENEIQQETNKHEVDKQNIEIQKELQEQKDLQQRHQKQLQQSQEHVENLLKENDNLQKELKKLQENLQIEIKKQQNLQQILQKPNNQSTNPFETSQLQNHISKALRPSKEFKDNSNQLVKSEIPINGGNNIILYYSPYYMFFNNSNFHDSTKPN